MKRVLFVDDEARVLDGLRDLLRRQRRRWDMSFALGGEAALAEIRANAPDVVVTDMRMPGMDGAALLAAVQRECPRAARIVLSGYSERESTMRSVQVAHQYLTKPCDAATLEGAIERVCRLQDLLTDPRLQETIGMIESLPMLPAVHASLMKALSDPEISSKQVAARLEEDTAICAKVMQLVNSSFFGLGRRVATVEEAVVYLGNDMIKNLVVMTSVLGLSETSTLLSAARVQRHALLVGALAQRIAPDQQLRDDGFLVGVLHDIGVLILAAQLPEHLDATLISLRDRPRPLHEAEIELWGVAHDTLGAYLLGLWGLPHSIVEAVAYHHRPWERPPIGTAPPVLDLLHLLYIADGIIEAVDGDAAGEPTNLRSALDVDYIEQLGVASELERWEREAQSLVVQQAGA